MSELNERVTSFRSPSNRRWVTCSRSWLDRNKLERTEGESPNSNATGARDRGVRVEVPVARLGSSVSQSGRFFGGALAEVCEHVEVHQNESPTVNHKALSLLTVHVRNIATELYHVLIMLTRGRAQRLVLKASKLEVLAAIRFLFQRYEPISTVTAFFEAGGHPACAVGLVGDGQSRINNFKGTDCSWCGTYGHMARDCRKQTEYTQNNQTSGWSGTDDKDKGNPGIGKGKHKQDQGKGKGKSDQGKDKNKKKKGANTTARKVRQHLTKWRGTTNSRHTKQSRLHRMDGEKLGSRQLG